MGAEFLHWTAPKAPGRGSHSELIRPPPKKRGSLAHFYWGCRVATVAPPVPPPMYCNSIGLVECDLQRMLVQWRVYDVLGMCDGRPQTTALPKQRRWLCSQRLVLLPLLLVVIVWGGGGACRPVGCYIWLRANVSASALMHWTVCWAGVPVCFFGAQECPYRASKNVARRRLPSNCRRPPPNRRRLPPEYE